MLAACFSLKPRRIRSSTLTVLGLNSKLSTFRGEYFSAMALAAGECGEGFLMAICPAAGAVCWAWPCPKADSVSRCWALPRPEETVAVSPAAFCRIAESDRISFVISLSSTYTVSGQSRVGNHPLGRSPMHEQGYLIAKS